MTRSKRRTRIQTPKGAEYNRRTAEHQRYVQEVRGSSAAQPHRNKKAYHRPSAKRGW